MNKVDYYILTNEYVLTKVEGRSWETYKFEDYKPKNLTLKYPLSKVDPFDDSEYFIPAIKNIVASTKRSYFRRKIQKNKLIVYVVDESNSTLRKTLFCESFADAKYKNVYLTDIGPSAVLANNSQHYKIPSIVVAVIGSIIEISFNFASSKIISHVVTVDFWKEFNEFKDKCKTLQNRAFEECVALDNFMENDINELEYIWKLNNDYQYVLASNNSPIDSILDSRFRPDYEVDFNKVVEIMDLKAYKKQK